MNEPELLPQRVTFEDGERIVVWTWTPGHKCLASVVEATAARAKVARGSTNRRRTEWTNYPNLTRRGDGAPVTYAMLVSGDLKP